MSTFDPNGVGIANGNIFGFPYTEQEADLVLVPVPWDATASYGKGTSKGPQAILEASTQLDFFHSELEKAYDTKVYISPVSQEWLDINDHLCAQGLEYISFLEEHGEELAQKQFGHVLEAINDAHQALRENLHERCTQLLQAGKIPCVLGGEHSTPLGLLQALDAQHSNYGILQVDAHADLRDAYEGFDVVRTGDGEEALTLAEEEKPDLVILDWMIEGTSGIEVCRRLRRDKATAHVPIIMLTAMGEETDRIVGLEMETGLVGDDDVANETVGVNPRGGEVIRDVKFADFMKQLQDETADATIDVSGIVL